VSEAAALSPRTLAGLLLLGRSLRRLRAAGCRALAAAAARPGGPSLLQLLRGPEPQHDCAAAAAGAACRLPSLHSLVAGWGFSLGVTAALVSASPFLARLELGLGAESNDGLLQRVAARCPHLQDITLRLAAAGTEGGRASQDAGGTVLGRPRSRRHPSVSPVSSLLLPGAAALLESCPKLRALRLQHCAGTLDGHALAAAVARPCHRCGRQRAATAF
jgi:hypothetical protein